jgi:hypothetical protein
LAIRRNTLIRLCIPEQLASKTDLQIAHSELYQTRTIEAKVYFPEVKTHDIKRVGSSSCYANIKHYRVAEKRAGETKQNKSKYLSTVVNVYTMEFPLSDSMQL